MFANASVVLVDNQESELEALARGLLAAGVPCSAVLYGYEDGVPDSISPSCAVRVLMTDMNLVDRHDPTPEQLAGDIASVIRRVIEKGPYLLVFWSKHADIAAGVMECLRARHPDLPFPLRYQALDKNALILPPERSDPSFIPQLQALKAALVDVLSSSKTLMAVTQWEQRVGRAAASTISGLFSVLPSQSGYDHEANFGALLALVAREAVGVKHIDAHLVRGLEEGLSPVLQDSLAGLVVGDDYQDVVRAAMADPKRASPASPFAATQLNKFYCLASGENVNKGDRGAWVKLSELPAEAFSAVFGKNKENLILDEFFSFQGHDLDAAAKKEKRSDILSRCQLGLIELSAGCDFAQKKDRLLRFTMSILIPDDLVAFTKFQSPSGVSRDRKHEGIFISPSVDLSLAGSQVSCIMKVNAMYTVGLPMESSLLGGVLFRIKAPLLEQISAHNAKHHTRIGIISFSA